MANENNGNGKAGVLTLDQIMQVRANSRTKGEYGRDLVALLEDSDDAAVNVFEAFGGKYAGKAPNNLAMGFRSAAKKAGIEDKIQVVHQGDNVFILVNERVEKLQAEAAAA